MSERLVVCEHCEKTIAENETLERSNERAWDSARFFAGRNELLRLHIRCHLGLAQMECIGWSDENYRDALLKEQEDET